MNMPNGLDRRSFLAWMGSVPAGGIFSAGAARASESAQHVAQPVDRGLAPPGDAMLAPGLVYLQTGSAGPTPRLVFERTVEAWRELEKNPVHYAYKLALPGLEEVRSKAASLLQCRPDETVLTRGTTDGMNAVACALDLRAGDRVLTTDQEHGGGRHCWNYLAQRRGIAIDEVAVPPGENNAAAIVERFRKVMTPATRVLSFSHVLYSTGMHMPVAELSALARRHGCLSVVDGAQVPGGIRVDVAALGCDVYVTSGHKWLLGPKGTGLLVVRNEARDRLPLMVEQAGRKAQNDSTGLTNVPGLLGLGAAIDYVTAIGIARIEEHNLKLRNRLFELLGKVPQVRVVSPPPGPLATPLITVQLPAGVAASDILVRLLERHQVVVKGLPNLPNGLRFSTHLFNSMQDVERAVEALSAEIS